MANAMFLAERSEDDTFAKKITGNFKVKYRLELAVNFRRAKLGNNLCNCTMFSLINHHYVLIAFQTYLVCKY